MENNSDKEGCDSTIEVCTRLVEHIVKGEIEPTIWLGILALLKTVTPAILRAFFVEEQNSESTFYKYGWAIWQISNMIIFGFILLLWPMSYYQITVLTDFYLALFETATLSDYALGFIAIISLGFLTGAYEDGNLSAWVWFTIEVSFESLVWIMMMQKYEGAEQFYRPKVEMIEV